MRVVNIILEHYLEHYFPGQNNSPGLTPGPGDSVIEIPNLAILPPLPHIALTLPHCQGWPSGVFDQIVLLSIVNS